MRIRIQIIVVCNMCSNYIIRICIKGIYVIRMCIQIVHVCVDIMYSVCIYRYSCTQHRVPCRNSYHTRCNTFAPEINPRAPRYKTVNPWPPGLMMEVNLGPQMELVSCTLSVGNRRIWQVNDDKIGHIYVKQIEVIFEYTCRTHTYCHIRIPIWIYIF